MSHRPTVAVLGAGAGGIAMGIRLKRAGYDFTIYEKSDGVGGTWRDNPGAACDVPSHLYSYSFELNPWWSRTYASQPEILAYLERCTDQYGVRPHSPHRHRHHRGPVGRRTALAAQAGIRRPVHRRRGGEWPRHAQRAQHPRLPGSRPLPGPVVPFRPLGPHQGARGRTGRVHRHRSERHPVRARHRGRGRAPDGVPADPGVGHPQARAAVHRGAAAPFRTGAVAGAVAPTRSGGRSSRRTSGPTPNRPS